MKRILFIISIFILPLSINSQNAKEIVQKANDLVMGKTNIGESKMTIVRPDWSREVTMKSWSKGIDYYLIIITAPARDKGQVFLKRENEMWNWMPSISRTIKIPPSMMMQSWMGSDFTNDDLLKESSIVKDYLHEITGSDSLDGYECYKIKLTPKPEAAVVWGKIIMWVTKKEYYQLKVEFFDEDEELINIQTASNIREIGGRTIPTKMTMIPVDKEGNQTILEFINAQFDTPLTDDFFSQQNMKRVR